MDLIINKIDAIIYGFIGPFAVLYIFPQFFLGLQESLDIPLGQNKVLDITGSILMWAGALIAIWCSLLMFLNKRGSPSPFDKPTKLVQKGPYCIVRHPMMWALNIVIFGEIIAWQSVFLVVWLAMWIRFSYLFIERYEEPYLHSIFGAEYQIYCAKTPRWIPNFIWLKKVD